MLVGGRTRAGGGSWYLRGGSRLSSDVATHCAIQWTWILRWFRPPSAGGRSRERSASSASRPEPRSSARVTPCVRSLSSLARRPSNLGPDITHTRHTARGVSPSVSQWGPPHPPTCSRYRRESCAEQPRARHHGPLRAATSGCSASQVRQASRQGSPTANAADEANGPLAGASWRGAHDRHARRHHAAVASAAQLSGLFHRARGAVPYAPIGESPAAFISIRQASCFLFTSSSSFIVSISDD